MTIIVDTDVISHFIRGGQIILLPSIFKTPIKLLDIVYKELEQWYAKRAEVDNLLRYKLLELIEFPVNDEIAEEFFLIKSLRFYGDGEAACMAFSKFNGYIVASNNLKDIRNYCTLHNIEYITTLDFLQRAIDKKKLTLKESNEFINKNIIKGRNPFPVVRMEDFKGRDISHIV